MPEYQSWGNYPLGKRQGVVKVYHRDEISDVLRDTRGPLLPRGRGRSQGDVCLNSNGTLIDATKLDRFIAFDREEGVIRAEAGVTLSQILQLAVPKGWFLPVTPGTKNITLGGAVANDVHGKNHHRAGTFGRYVRSLELVRSSGQRLLCSPDMNFDLFKATIGGLGLTGFINWIELQLVPVASSMIDEEVIVMKSLDDFFLLAPESDKEFEYTVAWIDCLARGGSMGRGLYMRGNHAQRSEGNSDDRQGWSKPLASVPFMMPGWIMNRWGVKALDCCFYHKQFSAKVRSRVHFAPFFFPLDRVDWWNRAYGRRGFLQYQCVVPRGAGKEGVGDILELVTESQEASFLSTMKLFGDIKSPGIMSFPRPGVALAVDFINRGRSTLALFKKLDKAVMRLGGAVNPSKDARMTGAVFGASYSRWEEFKRYIDPKFSSSFWRRVTD